MASDPGKPLLRLRPHDVQDRLVGKPRPIPRPESFPQARQTEAFSPKFERLAEVLNRDPNGLELRADPSALAPERLLVFEVRGTLNAFAAAVRRVPGLELVDEEELAADDNDKAPVAYLMVPDTRALRELENSGNVGNEGSWSVPIRRGEMYSIYFATFGHGVRKIEFNTGKSASWRRKLLAAQLTTSSA